MSLGDRLHALDRRQQQSPRLSFVAAVIKKFSDDQGGQLAALISYYGFVSLFPLLLVFVTVLGFVLDHTQREEIVNGALGQFPIVSTTLKPTSLKGSPVALAIGIVGALLSGLGIMSATQTAFDRIWAVPFKHRPNFIFSRLRSLAMLGILGGLSIVSTVAGGFVGTGSHSAPAVVLGVILASVLWQGLQHLGGFYIDHELKHTEASYGVFALVLGLLAWLYLGAQLVMIAAEVNVVKARRLWPRSFFSEPLLDADRRALTDTAEVEERLHEENVDVSFDRPDVGSSSQPR